MTYETGTRGRLLAGRLRIVGSDPTPGRPVAAVDRDAPPASAAVRVALSDPALDTDGRAAWAITWRALAERRLVVPLIDLVEDADLGPLVVIAMGTSRPVEAGSLAAGDQAERLGAALASAGLDLTGLRLDDLGWDDDGRLLLDTVRFPASVPLSPTAGAEIVAGLIGPVSEPAEPLPASPRPARSARRERGRRRPLLVASAVLLLGAGAITLLPDRASAPASIAPATPDAQVDATILRALEATQRPQREPARRDEPRRPVGDRSPAPKVTAVARNPLRVSPAEVVSPPPAEADPDALPLAASDAAASLPPLDGGDGRAPVEGDALPVADAGGLPPLAEGGEVGETFPPDAQDAAEAMPISGD